MQHTAEHLTNSSRAVQLKEERRGFSRNDTASYSCGKSNWTHPSHTAHVIQFQRDGRSTCMHGICYLKNLNVSAALCQALNWRQKVEVVYVCNIVDGYPSVLNTDKYARSPDKM